MEQQHQEQQYHSDFMFSENDLFPNLFNKDSDDIELFLNTFNVLAQKKNQLNELLKSLSSIKSENSVDSSAVEDAKEADEARESKSFAKLHNLKLVEERTETCEDTCQDLAAKETSTTESSAKNQETLTELSNHVWQVLLSQMEPNDELNNSASVDGLKKTTRSSSKKYSSSKTSSKSGLGNAHI